MPRSDSEQFFDEVVNLRALDTKHQAQKEVAVTYYNKLLSDLDSGNDGHYEPEGLYLEEVQKTIHALKQAVFNGSGLPCFANKETSLATQLQQHGHFGKTDTAQTETKKHVNATASTSSP